MGVFAALFPFIAGLAGKLVGRMVGSDFAGGALQAFLSGFNGSGDERVQLARIDADTGIAIATTVATASTTRQVHKMNQPVFWFVILGALGPPILIQWAVAAYNVFWWEKGIWPQPWAIAEFPGQTATWADMAMNWLFDPVGLGSTLGIATLAGHLTGKARLK